MKIMIRLFKTTILLLFSTISFAQGIALDAKKHNKKVVYQVFTRLFGNTKNLQKPWGTIEENGVGKFNDFTDKALREIKNLGVTHIWFTGVPHHALVADYSAYGISADDPDVVKGRAGSPYAVKDYYNVNPDLATDPSRRLEEFEALIERSHKNGLKVIIDIVPNHVARRYKGLNNPSGVRDFGADDNTAVAYARNNNFYYIPQKAFEVPSFGDYKPLGGEWHPLVDGKFDEYPAKWTGNGSRLAQPDVNDWYETVKVNYGIRPDGTKDFPLLPEGFAQKSFKEHYEFWKGKDVPDSWIKFRDIALYWTEKGVDGFRYDMAEMVPYEFWSFMNATIKMHNPDAFLLAEIYNPSEYRNYIFLGKMDYLYDKVGLYDKLKDVIRGKSTADELTEVINQHKDIEHHMLHFLDNHDEQRLASADFAGSGHNGKSLMVLSATVSSSPVMLYFGQEVGEAGNEDAGFGRKTRTSIFDYIGVPAHQRWMNNGKFDGGKLHPEEKNLRTFYQKLLQFTLKCKALEGDFAEIQSENRKNANYPKSVYSFVRWKGADRLLVAANLNTKESNRFTITVPSNIIALWKLKDGKRKVCDQLNGKKYELEIANGKGSLTVDLPPAESLVIKI